MPSNNSTASGPGPIPVWAWIFVAICIAIPVATLGGGIPGAIGAGGAGGCVAVARNDRMPVAARVGICLAISIFCWGLMFYIRSVMLGRPFGTF